jgi:hypothetical protein
MFNLWMQVCQKCISGIEVEIGDGPHFDDT